ALASICSSSVANMTSYVAQGSTTVVITLPIPEVAFPTLLAGYQTGCLGWIQSPTVAAKYGLNTGTSPESTVGAGPYILKDWVRGSQETFVRNPNYWDQPRPYVDTIIEKPVRDPNQALAAFEAGQGDIATFGNPFKALTDGAKTIGATVFG